MEQQAESLIDILNEFIGEALGDRPSHHLVLMVDNLDRIIERYDSENQQSNYEQIFVNHSDQLRTRTFSQTSLRLPDANWNHRAIAPHHHLIDKYPLQPSQG